MKDAQDAREVTEISRRVLPGAQLRDEQRESLRELPHRDTLVVLAPAAGKTAIYAIGGELLGGPTVVVSPTVSLQRDQVRALNDGGLTAAALNSTQPQARQRGALEGFANGDLQFLLLAPEQLAKDDVVEQLRKSAPALLVIDEAHCISEWGHDFRPEYLSLGAAADAMGRPRVLALTATAAPPVRDEIATRLGMQDPHTVVGDTDRPQLHLSVRLLHDEQAKWNAVAAEVAARDSSGIVYVATRRHADQFAQRLRDEGIRAGSYHGKLRRAERDGVQDAFMRGELRVVVATNAFGMGIDKPDVRFVLHADDPPSVDAYHQESGRAGRDGKPAVAVLYHRPQDLAVPSFHAAGADPDAEQLRAVLRAAQAGPQQRTGLARRARLPGRALSRRVPLLIGAGALREDADRRVGAAPDVDSDEAVATAIAHTRQRRELDSSRIEMVRRYAETTTCRRRTLLELLGEIRDEPCGRCDNCDAGRGGHREANDHDPLRPGCSVTHQEFGAGTVQTVDNGDIVVLFEQGGYRTLSRAVVTERGLLCPRDE